MGLPIISYNTKLKHRSRNLRHEMTLPERKFYHEVLKREPFKNYRFLRQKPLGSYIVDFYCSKLHLVIEIDGGQHSENMKYDKQRSTVLHSLGLRIVRYWNNDVMTNTEGVYEDLLAKTKPPPLPRSAGLRRG